jgi:hypothetical protein
MQAESTNYNTSSDVLVNKIQIIKNGVTQAMEGLAMHRTFNNRKRVYVSGVVELAAGDVCRPQHYIQSGTGATLTISTEYAATSDKFAGFLIQAT